MTANVDFVVGAQYGDEGKGMIAKLLADKAEKAGKPYEWTARVGGQNAEHRFIHDGCELTARILPSASAFRDRFGHTPLQALIGAGHCFNPEHLLLEAVHLGVPLDRIFLDSQAMWLRPEHSRINRERADARGSTGWGVGAALAEKVTRDPDVKLIRDSETIQTHFKQGNVIRLPGVIDTLFAGPGLFESSQGLMLSLNHGRYPFCTGKDVTTTNMCSELGLSHKRIRYVIGIFRLVFMRIPGPSGPTGGEEISYSVVEERTGLRFPQHRRLQGDAMRWTSSDGVADGATDEERLFEFSMSELIYSHHINGYDFLIVTFTDMHRAGNYRATKWSELHQDTRNEIDTIQDVLGLPVILVRTGQGEHDNIWMDEVNKLWQD